MLPLEVVQTVSDQIFEQLMAPEPGQRMFLLDGTTLTMPNTRPCWRHILPVATKGASPIGPSCAYW